MKLVFVAGGTGGHIYPALALADSFNLEDVLFIGSNSRMEATLIPSFNYKFYGLNISSKKSTFKDKINFLFATFKGFLACRRILKDFKPDLVFGFGNYISVPVILAAKSLNIKTLIHEQNSIPGKANLFLSKFCDEIVGSYEINKDQFNKKVKILGNPRASIAAEVKKDLSLKNTYNLDINKKLVLIVMGSLGSESVNKIMVDYLKNHDKDYEILMVTGDKQYDSFSFKDCDNIRVVSYIDNLGVMALADLIICRAGATTCAEICAMGLPSILIPSPYVPNNHQYLNAKEILEANACLLLEEKDLDYKKIKDMVDKIIFDDETLHNMSIAARSLAFVDAKKNIIKLMEEVVK